MSKKTTYWLSVIAVGLFVGAGLQVTHAWVNPPAGAPNGNIAGPVTTGPGVQYKNGTLKLDKLQLGNKWLLSGIGDAWGDDSWLRFFNANGSANYYGGIAANSLWSGGNIYTGGPIYGNVFYDSSNTGYYLNPAGSNRLNYGVFNHAYSYGWMQSPIFYDANNSGYYLDPSWYSVVHKVYSTSTTAADAGVTLTTKDYVDAVLR